MESDGANRRVWVRRTYLPHVTFLLLCSTANKLLSCSAVNTWTNAGKQNTAVDVDPTTVANLQAWSSGDIGSIAGLVQIPVCTLYQAGATVMGDFKNSGGNPYWPCPSGVAG